MIPFDMVGKNYETSESQTVKKKKKNCGYGIFFMKTVIILSDIDQTEGGNNEQFAHLDMTDFFLTIISH